GVFRGLRTGERPEHRPPRHCVLGDSQQFPLGGRLHSAGAPAPVGAGGQHRAGEPRPAHRGNGIGAAGPGPARTGAAMNDRPTAVELVNAVRQYLESELLPSLTDQRLKFQTLIAANVLSIAERELKSEEVDLTLELAAFAELANREQQPRTLME